jgi:hypothetical protein
VKNAFLLIRNLQHWIADTARDEDGGGMNAEEKDELNPG